MSSPASAPDLRDIHLPPAPSWWPPAPGWWLLFVIVLAFIIFAFILIYKMQKKRMLHRAIFAELDRCIAAAGVDRAATAAALSQFLRRVSRRESAAASVLFGEQWLIYLDQNVHAQDFSAGVGRALIEAPFQASPEYDVPGLIALVRRWTRQTLAESARA